MKHFTKSIQIIMLLGGVIFGIIYLFKERKTVMMNDKLAAEVIMPDFKLTNQNGDTQSFYSIKEKIKLVYFGFTSCPEVCPRILSKLTEVEKLLRSYQVPIKIIFISVDSIRDDYETMNNYLINLNPNILGLVGSRLEIKKVSDIFGAFYSESDFNIHSTFVYCISENKYAAVFHDNDRPQDIVNKILQISKRKD